MVYILGVNHSVQSNKGADQSKLFISFVRTSIQDLGITFVGEEWNRDASKLWKVQTTTVEDLVTELRDGGRNVETKYCDPALAEQRRLGIRSQAEIATAIGSHLKKDIDKEQAKDHPKREQFWLERISPYLGGNIIFVCGASHISGQSEYRSDGFDTLLKRERIPSMVFEQRFDEDLPVEGWQP